MDSVSIICCYTSAEELAYLTGSLEGQSMAHEDVFIDNSSNAFTSAAAALNHGARQAHGNLFLFVHQDVKFKDATALEDLVKLCATLKPGDVGGVAGAICVNGRKVTKTNITHSADERNYAAIDALQGEVLEVESVDECLIVLPRETWEEHPFDEELCDDWHCYGVEQCLYARKHGHKAYVFDARINHLSSTGTLNSSFLNNMARLVRYYGDDFDVVVATTGLWPKRGLNRTLLYVRLREAVKRMLRA